MSSQKGNSSRTRPQKHKNTTTFKNNLHDTSNRTKAINNIQVSDVCTRCKEIIEWKIKYKKYKPLTQPKKCVKCEQRNVRQAYHVMCSECGRKLGMCTKCCEAKAVVEKTTEKEQLKLDNELRSLLQTLPERKRRTFLRYLSKKDKVDESEEQRKNDLMSKLASLKVEEEDSNDSSCDSDY